MNEKERESTHKILDDWLTFSMLGDFIVIRKKRVDDDAKISIQCLSIDTQMLDLMKDLFAEANE